MAIGQLFKLYSDGELVMGVFRALITHLLSDSENFVVDQILKPDAKFFSYYIPIKSWKRGLLEELITSLP